MNLSSTSQRAGNLLNSLQDKLGIGSSRNATDEYYDEYDYDEYAEYAPEDGFVEADGGYSYGSGEQDEAYDAGYTTRSSRAAQTSRVRSAPLVSSRDIYSTTSAYGVADVSASEAETSSGYGASHAGVASDVTRPASSYTDFVSPYQGQSSVESASVQTSRTSAGRGADALFQSTTVAGSGEGLSEDEGYTYRSAASSRNSGTASASSSRLDPYAAYEEGGSFTTARPREISVVSPQVYDDVANVSRSVLAGDIVVLSLKAVDAALARRVLDFSFGVASALEASVSCVAEKTFIIVRGKALTPAENSNLRSKGIM